MLLAWLFACSTPPTPPPDVVVVTLDTTRADVLGSYGRTPSPTPVLDALAADGVRFDEAMTVTPLTLPAHASLWTGRYPDRTGLRDNQAGALPDTVPTVATRLREAGWQTGAFVSAAVLERSVGLDAGFETYDDAVVGGLDPNVLIAERDAAGTLDAVLDWWSRTDGTDAPRLTWVHLYDAHHPWQAPDPWRDRFDPYQAEVASMDAQLARLRAATRDRPTFWVVAGDHGEGLGDHGELLHGLFLYRSTMRVPLLLAGPGLPPGVRTDPVSLVDVAPTLLEVAGLPALPEQDGHSLLAEPLADRQLYGESFLGRYQYGMHELRVWQDDRLRYHDGPTPELYDWRSDPGELDNLWLLAPSAAPADALQAFVAGREPLEAASAQVDLQALAALGYVSGPPMPVQDLLDPSEHRDIVAKVELLVVSARTRPPAEAVPLLRAFTEAYPGVGVAWVLLARALQLSGQHADALEVLEQLRDARDDDPQLHAMLAQSLMDLERHAEAGAALDQALSLRPGDPSFLAMQAELARRQGDCGTAVALAEQALARSPDDGRLHLIHDACTGEASPFALQRRFALQRASEGALVEALGQLAPLEPAMRELGDAVGLAVLADLVLRVDGPSDRVATLLDAAEVADPEEVQVHLVRAQYLTEAGDIPAAIAAQQRAGTLGAAPR